VCKIRGWSCGERRPTLQVLKSAARYARLLTPLLAVLLLTGCNVAIDTPQNTFAPVGEVARDQRHLFFLAMWPAVVILALVWGAVLYIVFRYRHRPGAPAPRQIHGNQPLEIAWTLAPLALLLGLAGPMIGMIIEQADRPDPAENPLQVRVIGQQWVWRFQYPQYTDSQGRPLEMVGRGTEPAELHLPPNRKIDLAIESIDVIHSFWAPRLGGKVDAIPGRVNHLWLIAEEPGEYGGQCAEFCGLAHADMRMRVIVHDSQESFDAWAREQLARQGQQAAR